MNKGFAHILLLIIGLVVGGTVVYFATSANLPSSSEVITETNTNAVLPSSSPAYNYSNWLTYKNNNPSFSISYPEGWVIDASGSEIPEEAEAYRARIRLTKKDYSILVEFPSAYGPGMCLFDDQMHLQDKYIAASICRGEYKEFGSTPKYRRYIESSDDKKVNWSVLSKAADGVYTSVPPISFITPKDYDETILREMDEIIVRNFSNK